MPSPLCASNPLQPGQRYTFQFLFTLGLGVFDTPTAEIIGSASRVAGVYAPNASQVGLVSASAVNLTFTYNGCGDSIDGLASQIVAQYNSDHILSSIQFQGATGGNQYLCCSCPQTSNIKSIVIAVAVIAVAALVLQSGVLKNLRG